MRLIHFVLLASCLAVPAYAQTPALGVMDRERPDYDAKGLPLGAGLRLKPSLDVGASIDDNVDRTSTAPQSDIYFTFAPSAVLSTDWAGGELQLTAGLARYQYASLTSENRTDWNVGLSTRADIWHDIGVSGSSSYGLYHEPRNSAEDAGNAATSTAYSLLHTDLGIEKQPDSFGVAVGGSFNRFDYRATPLIGGGVQTNDDRDERTWGGYAKASYALDPDAAVFIRGSYDARRFDSATARNSNGYRADLGADLFLSHLVRGEVFVGYVNLQFKAPLPSIATVDYGAALHWYATDLLTVNLTAARTFNDTNIAGASVSDDKSFGLSLDYELLRNLIVQSHVGYTDSRFVGAGRTDRVLEAGLNVRYLLNRYMSADASYVWQDRSSNVVGGGFRDNTVSAGLHFQL